MANTKKQEDIFDTIASQSDSGDVFDRISPTEETPKANTVGSIAGGVAGLGAMGVAGYGAYKGAQGVKNYWQAPSKMLSPIEQELTQMQQKMPSMQGMRFQDMPGRISSEMAEQRLQLKDFDDLTLATSAEDLASSVKSAYPKLRESNFAAYRNTLNVGEEAIIKTGTPLDGVKLNSDVIEKSATELRKYIPEDKLQSLKAITRNEGNRTISLQQAKKTIETIKKGLPSEGQRVVDKYWGKFLETNAPPEVAEGLTKANIKYTNFLEQEKALKKLIDPTTGDYDYDKLYRYTFQRAKTNINSDFKKLMSGLEEVAPEVGTKAKDLYALRGKRIEMKRTLNSLRTWLTKAEELISKREALLEKFPARLKSFGKHAGDVGKTLGRAAIFKGIPHLSLGVIESIMGNPALQQEFGTTDPLEIISRAIGTKKTPEEEFRKWQEANRI